MNLIMSSAGPFDPDSPDGYYLRNAGHGYEIIVVGPMPHTPANFEDELSQRVGIRYEITHASGMAAPDGYDEQAFFRRGFWRMSFYPSSRIIRGDVSRVAPQPRPVPAPPRRSRTAEIAEATIQRADRQRADRALRNVEVLQRGTVWLIDGRVVDLARAPR